MASWFTRVIDRITPWDRGGEAQRRQERKRREDEERQRSQPQPTQSPRLSVGVAQPTQQISVRQPENRFNNSEYDIGIKVAPVQDNRRITLPKPTRPLTPEEQRINAVNRGLDAGKSWEDIARENQLDLDSVREYSKATRPDYGIRVEKPKQSFWNKVRDQFDANTQADQWRRQQGNRLRGDNKPIVLENPGNIGTATRDFGVEAVKGVGRGIRAVTTTPIEAGRSSLAQITGNKEAERMADYRMNVNLFGREAADKMARGEKLSIGDAAGGAMDIISVLPALAGARFATSATRAGLAQGGRLGASTASRGILRGVDDAFFGVRDVRNLGRGAYRRVRGRTPTPAAVPSGINDLDDAAIAASAEAAIQATRPRPIRVAQNIPVDIAENIPQPINVRNLNNDNPIIREIVGDARTANEAAARLEQAAQQARETAFNTNIRDSRPDRSVDGITLRQSEAPYQLDPKVVTNAQDKLIDDYAEQLRQMGEGNGVDILPDGRRVSNNVRFGDTGGKRMTKADWREEAERQLRSGRADPAFQREFSDIADPEVQSMLARGERPDVPEGRPIQVREERGIDVVDRTDMPTNLPETPGTVRVTTQADPQATRTQAAAEQPVTPPSQPRFDADGNPVQGQYVVDPSGNVRPAGNTAPTAGDRTTTRMVNSINDPEIKAAIEDTLKQTEKKLSKVNIEETTNKAYKKINQMTDNEVVASAGKNIENPQDLLDEYTRFQRLSTMERTPDTLEAISKSIEAIRVYEHGAGTQLRMFRELFKNMSPEMKLHYITNKVSNRMGADFTDEIRDRLLRDIEVINNKEAQLGEIKDALRANSDNLKLTGQSNLSADELAILNKRGNELIREIEIDNSKVAEFAARQIQKSSGNKVDKVIQASKTGMLSGPFGAARDIVVTGLTSIGDIASNVIGGTAGRVLNKLPGQYGRFREFRLRDLSELGKGNWQGAKDTARAIAKDERRLDSLTEELQRATRSDSKAGLRTRVGRYVSDTREAATNMTRGQRDMMNTQLVRQQGQKLGLKGEALDAYVSSNKLIADALTQDKATQYWLRTNSLHRNGLSEAVSSTAAVIERAGGPVGKFVAHISVPFKSWMSGNLNRLFTDKNMVYNIYKTIDGALIKKDPQMVVDNVSKFLTNGGEALVAGTLLYKAGVLSDTNTNGEDYEGPYLNIGNRSISLSTFGPAAMNMMVGYNLGKFQNNEVDVEEFGSNLMSQARNVMGADTLSGQTPIQTVLAGDKYGNEANVAVRAATDTAGMFIPGAGALGNVNSLLNMNSTLNPTGERAKTTARNADDKYDPFKSGLNRLQNRIPFLSQSLPRDEGKTFNDPIDFVTAGSHANESSSKARADEQAKADQKLSIEQRDKDYESRGIPKTGDGILKAFENDDWDKVIEGNRWALERAADDGEISQRTKDKYEREIRKAEILRDNNLSSADWEEYDSIDVEEWRKMGIPPGEKGYDEDLYDPEAYERLWQIDQLMAQNNVSDARGKPNKQKYSIKESKSGSSRGGSRKYSTEFGKITGSGSNPINVRSYASMLEQARSGSTTPLIRRTRPNIVHRIGTRGYN